MIHSEWRP